MEIPVKEVLIKDPGKSTESVNEIANVLGENVLFEQKRERNFIDKTKKTEMFKELYDSFVNSTLIYLSNEAFPRKYITKKYQEAVEKAGNKT
jgi:predicted RNase H-like nuclease